MEIKEKMSDSQYIGNLFDADNGENVDGNIEKMELEI